MNPKNKIILIALLTWVGLLAPKNAYANLSDDYGFPFKNPLIATFMAAANGAGIKHETVDVEFRTDRRNYPLLKNRNKIALGLFLQNHEAPLAFIIAGAGSGALSGNAFVLAQELQKIGYSVVTLPDPVSWTYVVGRSDTALPGYIPRDSKEYYNFLQEVTTYLKTQKRVQISDYSILGYSLGGLTSAYLTQEDARQNVFNFKKIVAINPAIDLGHAINVLDGFYQAGDHFTQQHKDFLVGGIQVTAENLIDKNDLTPKSVLKAFQDLRINDTDLKWLIGSSFRSDLTDVIFTSQQINDQGILKVPADSLHMNGREFESGQISFHQYMEQFVMPAVMKEFFPTSPDPQAALASTSLYQLAALLKSNSHIFIMENEDDILVQPKDLEFFRANLGDRFYLYPHGGHIGNIAFPKNLHDLDEIMQRP